MPPIPTTSERTTRSAGRLASIDALRGAAIVLMVVWHAADGWLAPAHRTGWGWHTCRVVGGLAAPAFLVVAGVAVAIAIGRGRPTREVVRRGLELMGLGFLLRLTQWSVDSGGLLTLEGALLATLALASLGIAWRRRALRRGGAPAGAWVALQVAAAGAYLAATLGLAGEHAPTLLRFDVLHCIGASIAVAAAVSAIGSPRLALLIACATFALAPTVAGVLDGSAALAWLAQPRVGAAAAWARFPLLPFLGWALLGVSAASFARRELSLRSLALVGLVGVAVAVACFEGGLWITRRGLHLYPLARPHVHNVFVLGALLGAGAIVVAAARITAARALLVPLGRHSLLIYALHLEFVYGLLALPMRRALSPLFVALGSALLLASAAGLGAAFQRRPSAEPEH